MILIALGGNLRTPDGSAPAETIQRAFDALVALPGITGGTLSGLWDSAPVPASDQPRYVNAVCRLEGRADPSILLAALHGIESRFGRVRGERNAPRTLDIDLLDLDGIVRDDKAPILPHPRLAGRAFVLMPLTEVAPGWRHPVSGETVEAMIHALPEADRAECRPLGQAPGEA
ncbi:2-amino-4-hydroxy-6-hydroxymethyldihydropteridine diphosphokinase [Elioraea rosea]|uniref:2-amino-4-hydroxy-6- hydroxymethyldihydropteridine diphosphokinase n=1 Tax=Elioraea rosea TaxID=2492390 RepID=UPI0011831601|nr:2-amino-4-hydroxy-6-hydroxymethyldihydropteridine diphosphokinase [Elioraea rosea]